MKSALPKPLLRVATAHASAATNNSNSYPRSNIHKLPSLASSAYSSSSSSSSPIDGHVHTSTTAVVPPPHSNIHFLRRTFSSRTYPAPFKYKRSFIPLGTLALLGGAMLYWTTSTVAALSIYPFSSKPNAATRMKERLEKHGFTEKPVAPDGNCQMRALSDQLFGDEKNHKEVRLKIMQWLSSHEKFAIDDDGGATLGDFIDRDQFPQWSKYVSYMSQNGAWGDHITLLAASEVYGITITILSNVDDGGSGQYLTSIKPRSTKSTKEVYLSHWHEMHYNSLYSKTANPSLQAQAA